MNDKMDSLCTFSHSRHYKDTYEGNIFMKTLEPMQYAFLDYVFDSNNLTKAPLK